MKKSDVRNLVTLSLSAHVYIEETLSTVTKTKLTLQADILSCPQLHQLTHTQSLYDTSFWKD
jgi:hypothetical protein